MKPRKGLPKPVKSQHVKTGGAVGDNSMEEMEDWMQQGCGVSEEVRSVGNMPNESVMRPEDNEHLR